MEPDLNMDAWSAFALQVFALNALVLRAGEGIARPLGQSSTRWQVLGRVQAPRTVPDLAREIGLARQAVQRTADLLAADGLVDYREHPTDRRTRLVELTEQGRQVMALIYSRQVDWSTHVMSRLDEADLRELTRHLEHVADVLQTLEDGETPSTTKIRRTPR